MLILKRSCAADDTVYISIIGVGSRLTCSVVPSNTRERVGIAVPTLQIN